MRKLSVLPFLLFLKNTKEDTNPNKTVLCLFLVDWKQIKRKKKFGVGNILLCVKTKWVKYLWKRVKKKPKHLFSKNNFTWRLTLKKVLFFLFFFCFVFFSVACMFNSLWSRKERWSFFFSFVWTFMFKQQQNQSLKQRKKN